MDKTQLENYRWLLEQLKQAVPQNEQIPKEAFAFARQGFEHQRERMEQAALATEAALEYAFDFMEQAFPTGQEMVVFVTNLTVCNESAAFLTEHTCERYTKYNQKLLIGTRREQLLSELEQDSAQERK